MKEFWRWYVFNTRISPFGQEWLQTALTVTAIRRSGGDSKAKLEDAYPIKKKVIEDDSLFRAVLDSRAIRPT